MLAWDGGPLGFLSKLLSVFFFSEKISCFLGVTRTKCLHPIGI